MLHASKRPLLRGCGRTSGVARSLAGSNGSGEVVNNDFFPKRLAVIDELQVLGMDLIIVLRLLIREDEVEGDLIGLINYGAMAADHFPHVEVKHEIGRAHV